MSKKKLLVVGELNVDLILNTINGFPEIGKEIIAEHMTLTLGSSSAIMAANAASMGVETSFCGMIGNDAYGDLIIRDFEKKRVDTQFIKKLDQYKTGITIVMNYDQDRANVTYCGAMEMMTLADIPWGVMKKYQHLHLSNFFIQKELKKDIVPLFKKAKENGVTTSLDLQWDPSNSWDFDYRACLPYIDVFMPNEAELLALTKEKTVEEGLEAIKPFTNNIIALKMGQKGSMGIHGEDRLDVPAFQNRNNVDSIGAGDSFNSGFIKKYMEGASLRECLTYGNLMGAINTTAAGGTAAFMDEKSINEQVKSILDQVVTTK